MVSAALLLSALEVICVSAPLVLNVPVASSPAIVFVPPLTVTVSAPEPAIIALVPPSSTNESLLDALNAED